MSKIACCVLCGINATKVIILNDGHEFDVCDSCTECAIREYATTENPVYELSEISDDPEWSL